MILTPVEVDLIYMLMQVAPKDKFNVEFANKRVTRYTYGSMSVQVADYTTQPTKVENYATEFDFWKEYSK